MILTLDSSVVVDAMRGEKPHVRVRIGEALTSGDELVLSTIAVQELVMGAHLSARPEHQLRAVAAVVEDFRVEPWTWDDALATGRLRAEHERLGRRLAAYDELIAGQALARGWTVVTANVRDFWGVEGLPILDWSDPAGPIDVIGAVARLRRPSKD